jgi:serine/threonine protein kinase/tetratricopeptide (TPR) repeat protein
MSEASPAEAIFFAALELPPADRPAFLDRACAGDAGLRARIEQMLAAQSHLGGFLDPPEAGAGVELQRTAPAVPPAAEAAGAVIAGKYKLLERIGEGGMGSVWVAEQLEPVRRRVAVKLIRGDRGSSQTILARFDAERQAIALMDHPNIAKLFDAGTTGAADGPGMAAGRPYFVMELIKGVPLNEFCDRHLLGITERLVLFTQICSAVQHAHQKGITHRDLKPTNVLVESHDGKPVPKVIDFGLAKAVSGQPLTEHSLVTHFGTVVGTPLYMAPEQAHFNAIDVDTRADVYALGVNLYELLTGTTPVGREQLQRAALDEVLRLIREGDPPTPSRRLSSADTQASVAAKRLTEPAKLCRLLRGDLDWIVMKALSKERDRRYESASAFARDVERFLNHEPVLAGPPGTVYRLRKFVRRNRAGVVAGVLLLLALLLGLAGTTFGLIRAEGARRRATAAEAEARKQADEVRQVADYQAQMLRQIDPAEAGVKLTADLHTRLAGVLGKGKIPEAERTARLAAFDRDLHAVNATDAAVAMLDRIVLAPAVRAIETQFAGQPKVAASLRMTLGEVYGKLGRDEAHLALARQAYALRAEALGEEHRDTLGALAAVGFALSELRKTDEAESTLRRALETCRRVLGPDDPQTLAVQNQQALLLHRLGKPEECEACARDVLERRTRVLGPEHADTLRTMSALGLYLRARDKRDEAAAVLRTAVEAMRRQPNPDRDELLAALDNLGNVLTDQVKFDRGKVAEAEPYLREELDGRRRFNGEDHPSTLVALNNLASLLQFAGRLDEAEPLAREAVEKSRRIRGDEHRDTLATINVLGQIYHRRGKLEKAEPLYREALATGRRVLGEDHPDTITWVSNLSVLLREEGKYTEAEPLAREAAAKLSRTLGGDHLNSIIMLAQLGALFEESGKPAEAETTLREVLEKARRKLGEGHPLTLSVTIRLGRLLANRGSAAESIALLVPIEAKAREKYTSAQPYLLARLLLGLGKARIALAKTPEDFAAATANLVECREVYAKIPDPDHSEPRASTQALVDAYAARDKAEPGKGYGAKAAEWKAKLGKP